MDQSKLFLLLLEIYKIKFSISNKKANVIKVQCHNIENTLTFLHQKAEYQYSLQKEKQYL